jgi:GntR family transcriptional regulator, transcriptional repressor for pyruvate dehydrogenase complex
MLADIDATPALAAASRPNLSTYLAQQVLSLIRDRNLQPGDRLPSAKALAEQFAVATPTMREALRRLQATGVIDIRHGSGIYVRRDQERLMLSNPAYGVLETHTILQVLDARLLIEPHLAELAAQRSGEAEVAEIALLLERSKQALARPDDGYYHANNAFHSAIARASGNLVLAHVVESLIELYSTELHVVDPTSSLAEIRGRDHRNHQLIFEAIRDGDAMRAREAMVRHIEAARGTVVPLAG